MKIDFKVTGTMEIPDDAIKHYDVAGKLYALEFNDINWIPSSEILFLCKKFSHKLELPKKIILSSLIIIPSTKSLVMLAV